MTCRALWIILGRFRRLVSLSRVNPKVQEGCRVCTLVPGRRHQEVEITVDPERSSMCVPWYPEDVTKLLKSLCGPGEFHKCTLVPRKSQQESEINVIPSHVYPGTQRPCQELKSLCGLGEFHKCTLVPKKHNQEAEITMWIPGSPTCVPWCLRRHC